MDGKMVNTTTSQIDTAPTATASGTASGTRKPMNAFFLFCKRHRALVKEMYPNLENRNITKILGEWWSTLSMDEKEPFNALAVTYKEHLMKEKPSPSNLTNAHRKPPQSNHFSENVSDQMHQQQQSLAPPQPKNTGESNNKSHDEAPSRGSSGSSSPEPPNSGGNQMPFKKRYLAAEKAKTWNSNTSSGFQKGCSDQEAAVLLLQLAEGDKQEKTLNNGKANSDENVKEFSVLKKAVWVQVAKTIMTQEEEKGKNATNNKDDQPINLSSQCAIANSTIIEHIIENILSDNVDNNIDSSATSVAKSDGNRSTGVAKNGTPGSTGESTEQIKEKIYQSLKDDMMKRTSGGSKDSNNDLSALWKMLPNPKMSMSQQKNGVTNTNTNTNNISALGLSNLPQKTNAASSASKDSKAHSAPASQSGSGAPSPRGETDLKNPPSVSVTLVQTSEDLPLNLSTTPPQTPASSSSIVRSTNGSGVAVTITTSSPAKRKLLEDDDDDIRRSSRACKGRRYQEFKDTIGKRGRRGATGKSDSELSQHSEDEQQPSSQQSSPSLASFSNPSVPSKTNEDSSFEVKPPPPPPQSLFSSNSLVAIAKPLASSGTTTTTTTHFDLEKALTAIPALRPEEFQKRIQVNRQQRSHTESSSHANSAATVASAATNNIAPTANVTDHAMTSGSSNAKRFKGAARQRSASGGNNAMVS